MAANCAIRILVCLWMSYIVSGADIFLGERLFVGCFKDFHSRAYDVLSLESCIRSCATKSFYFAAIKSELECHCGNILSSRVPSGECRKKKLYAVYTVTPAYLGCFRDSKLRDLGAATKTEPLTNENCVQDCLTNHFRFAATQYSDNCYCGYHYGKFGKSTVCNMPCTGNSSQICGSSYANSIYAANHLPGLMLYYSDVFHCADGVDVFGYCVRNKCKFGWKGSRCHLRDCKINNGQCEDHKCIEFEIHGQPVSECLCGLGFESPSIFESCKDIDECKRNLCNIQTNVCVNTFGSYFCNSIK